MISKESKIFWDIKDILKSIKEELKKINKQLKKEE